MANTTAQEVYDSFEATFSDKKVIPTSLELQWLKMSVAKYNAEIAVDTLLTFDSNLGQFNTEIDQYVIDTLGEMMRNLYQEREYSRANKIASIVANDISINSGMSLSKNAKEELDYHSIKEKKMIDNQKTTAMA